MSGQAARPPNAPGTPLAVHTRGCPVGPSLVAQVEAALVAAGYRAEVALVWDPPWTPADISAEGREKLGR